MSLINCPRCGSSISNTAKDCPKCNCNIKNATIRLDIAKAKRGLKITKCPECGSSSSFSISEEIIPSKSRNNKYTVLDCGNCGYHDKTWNYWEDEEHMKDMGYSFSKYKDC